MALLAVERFLVEFLRAKDDRFFGAFTLAQLISVGLLLDPLSMAFVLLIIREQTFAVIALATLDGTITPLPVAKTGGHRMSRKHLKAAYDLPDEDFAAVTNY